ncbi:MAG: InlB B-repeat-containing protein, partial [Treponema sp.]|nr:InlB B-repeat-containing protein [Treponema sp.]
MKSEMLLRRFHERRNPMLQGGLMLGAALLCLALAGCKNPSAGGVEQTPQYTVTFDVDGGTSKDSETLTQTRTVEEGAALGAEDMPPEPEKDGYSFGGWWTEKEDGEERFAQDTPVNGNITVYAKWISKDSGFTVTFDADGGEPAKRTRTVNKGEALGPESMPGDPARKGYKFLGWWTSRRGGGNQFTQETPVSKNITVYAKWIPLYTVSFDTDGGEPGVQTREIEDGGTLGAESMPSGPARGGYSFGGWWTEKEGAGKRFTQETKVTKDITVYAKWVSWDWGKTATFNADGGEPPEQFRTVEEGAALGAADMPPEPVKSGHKFLGWWTEKEGAGERFTQETKVTENITVYAKWVIARTVSFDAAGGSPETQTRIVEEGAAAGELPLPAKSGAVFAGWYYEQDGKEAAFTQDTPVTADITVYAKWVFRVSFNAALGTFDDGSETQTLDVAPGGLIYPLPENVSREGFSLGGWYTERNGWGTRFTANDPVNSQIDLFAKWVCKVTFNAAEGTIGGSQTRTLDISPGEAVRGSAPSPARENYAFEGWYTEPDGGGDLFTGDTKVMANITLYAKWGPIRYTVTFDAAGGSPETRSVRIRQNTALGELPGAPERGKRYTFGGWYTEADGGEPFAVETLVTEDITVYAKWIRGAFIDLAATPEDAAGEDWTYANNVYTIKNGAEVTVTNKTTTRRIVAAGGATATITLENADIQLDGAAPLDVYNANVTLKLAGNNFLKVVKTSNWGRFAGIRAPNGSVLTITSAAGDGSEEGALEAQGAGNGGTGIGGMVNDAGYYGNGGEINIKGGTIKAVGTHNGAGIGGSGTTDTASHDRGSGGKVTISGGRVTATSGNDSAGIGDGLGGWGGEVYITGGTVIASGRTGIGASLGGAGGKIEISGGTVKASNGNGNGNGAGLGWESGNGGTITITGGTITATGRGAGIGGTTNGGTITITGGTITATGGNGIGGTNGGTITITGGSVKASKVLSPPVNGGGAPVYLNT